MRCAGVELRWRSGGRQPSGRQLMRLQLMHSQLMRSQLRRSQLMHSQLWDPRLATCPGRPRRVLPLNQICAGTLRALRFMMEDVEGAAHVARGAPAADTPTMGPPRVVAVPVGGVNGAAKPPAVVTTRHRSSSNGRSGADADAQAETWSVTPPAGAAAAGVELSGPSGVPTPSTARPTSPDPPDTFAGGLL